MNSGCRSLAAESTLEQITATALAPRFITFKSDLQRSNRVSTNASTAMP